MARKKPKPPVKIDASKWDNGWLRKMPKPKKPNDG